MKADDAPSVTYPVGRTPRLAWLLAGLWLAGAAAIFGAFFSAPALVQHGFFAIFLGVSALLSGGACLAFWRGQRARQLVWDGERWSLMPPDSGNGGSGEAQPHVQIDLQRALLLRLDEPQARRLIWLWAEAGHDSARWHLLRCALYSSKPSVVAELAADERVPGASAAPFGQLID